MLLHMTFNKLVLTSRLHQQHQHVFHWCCPVCIISVHWLLTLNKPLFQSFVSYAVCIFDVDLFNVSSRYATRVILLASNAKAAKLEQAIVSVVCLLPQFAK